MSDLKIWEGTPPLYDEKLDVDDNLNCPYIEDYIIRDKKIHSVFVVCPGGGYDHRADHEGANVAKRLNEAGISAVVLNYRVYPYRHPVEINDAKRTIRYLRYNAKKLKIDPDKIGIMGFSAGGHLAISVAEHYDEFDYTTEDDIDKVSAKPNATCLCYPVVSLIEEYTHPRSGENVAGEDMELLSALSGEKSVRDGMGPVFIWHTMEDKSVPCKNSVEMALALREKGIDTELHLFQNGKHGLDLAEGVEGTEQWFGLFVNWLKRKGYCI